MITPDAVSVLNNAPAPAAAPAAVPAPAPAQPAPPMRLALTPEQKASFLRRIEKADSDQELLKIKKELEALGIDTSLIPALREF